MSIAAPLNVDSVALSRPDADTSLLDANAVRTELANHHSSVLPLKSALSAASALLDQRFKENDEIEAIVRGRAWAVDQILMLAWEQQQWPDIELSLVAVGGYGRGELAPHSDIDILLLTRKTPDKKLKAAVSGFLTLLWDIGLEIGQSVRSIKQCVQEASSDITVATALMESRTLVGPESLQADMYSATTAQRVWPIKKFMRAKWDEQLARHEKYHDIDYALQPNVKTSPGGLRDIQTIAWVAKRHFNASSFSDLVELGFLSRMEQSLIDKGQNFLWRVRYGLHLLEGRREDRLLFDKQRELAKIFGYEDDELSLGVEKLMQRYYRTVGTLRGLNDLLLQHFDEVILRSGEREHITPLNNRFQVRNDYLEVLDEKVFARAPFALIEVFVLCAQNPQIQGVRASTIRLIRDNRHLIDDEFRADIRCVTLFMELLRSPNKVTFQLRRMARYGILGRYLPEFGKIMGKMQHDLFHIYTVDAHTLQVVENMRRLWLPETAHEFPLVSNVVKNLPKIELLYIAGLYHDIAKGRGGDHSKLGMKDAVDFCERHHLSSWDAKLVSWLVDKHLLMSMTAQRKDISDPEVIHEFASIMGDKLHLDYLYSMTVADIRATNPELWNSWRASLMSQLYLNTKQALRSGLENPQNREDRITDKKDSAKKALLQRGVDTHQIDSIWAHLDDEYFVRESAVNIAWHSELIANSQGVGPIVALQELTRIDGEGATQVFIYTKDGDFLFANTTATLERLRLNVQGARIFTSTHGYCLDTFTVLEESGRPVGDSLARVDEIKAALSNSFEDKHQATRTPQYRQTRKDKYFASKVIARLLNHPERRYSTLEINCPDHPGILASVGKLFVEESINIKDARITTLGERVEDLFYITNSVNEPITDETEIEDLISSTQETLEKRLES